MINFSKNKKIERKRERRTNEKKESRKMMVGRVANKRIKQSR